MGGLLGRRTCRTPGLSAPREANYRTAVLSNTNPIHWAQAERDYFGTDGYTVADYFDTLSSLVTCTFRNPSGHFRPRHGGTGLRTGRDSILR